MIKLTLASISEYVVAMALIKDDSEILRIAVHESFLGQEGCEVQLDDAIPNEPFGVPKRMKRREVVRIPVALCEKCITKVCSSLGKMKASGTLSKCGNDEQKETK